MTNVKKSKILLIWEEVPETTKLFLLPPSEYEDWILSCDSHYINHIDTAPPTSSNLTRICDAIQDNPEWRSNNDDPLAGKWVKYELGKLATLKSAVIIVRCGFLL